ncbi:phage head-tail connector protein [Metasolibacillus meyeri]|uniref:Phage head-tail connector protein n=1 Tax=Metasolibacillus meyeri TaxID=1071052 RepID=A0AAW9NPX5_9BACL|nr:phage head-tail connector protein [Metasolibacillus meyeri]MEC1178536.1 phage head-tail connector protein [Metasolibacillus meyeri]
MDTLERVKIRLGIPTDDGQHDQLLILQIDDAENFFKDYCKRKDRPSQAQHIIEKLVVELRENHGGIQSEKIGDTSTSYFENIISDELKRQLNRYRKTLIM